MNQTVTPIVNLRRLKRLPLKLIALFAIALLSVTSLPSWAKLPPPSQAIPALSAESAANDPVTLYQQGQFEAARKLWETAANAAAQNGDRPTEISNRINEAQALKSLGTYPRAETVLKTTLATLETVQPNQQAQQIALLELHAKAVRSLGEVYQAKGDLNQARTTLKQSLELAKQLPTSDELSAAYFSLGMTERSAMLREAPRLLSGTSTNIDTVLKLLQAESNPASQETSTQANPLSLSTVDEYFQKSIQFDSDSMTSIRNRLSQLSLWVNVLPAFNRYLTSTLKQSSDQLLKNNPDYLISRYVKDHSLVQDLQVLAPVLPVLRENFNALDDLTLAEKLANLQDGMASLTDRTVQGLGQMASDVAQLPNTLEAANIRILYAQTLLRLKPVADESDRVDAQLRQQLKTLLKNVQSLYEVDAYRSRLPNLATLDPVFAKIRREFQQPQRSLFLSKETRVALQQFVQNSLKEAVFVLNPAIETARTFNNVRIEANANVLLANVYSFSADLHKTSAEWATIETLSKRTLQLIQTEDAPDLMLRAQQQYARSLIRQSKTEPAQAACQVAASTLQTNRGNLVTIDQDVQYSFLENVDPFYRECVTTLLPQGSNAPTQGNLKDARNLIEALQLAELDNFFREACIEGRQEALDTIIEDQKSLNTAVIYPVLLSEKTVGVILKLPDTKDLQYFPTQPASPTQSVDALLAELTEKVSNSTGNNENIKLAASQVYQLLIAPFREQLKTVDTLVFVPDAAFRNVPMATLYDGQHYLIDDFAIALSPGLQLTKPSANQKIPLKAIGAGLIDVPKEYGLGSFPKEAIDREFEAMKKVGILRQEALLGPEFTSAQLAKSLEENPFNVVHLSTHAGFSSQKDETYVLMANGKINVDDFSAILQKRVQQQEGAIDLLVLSACQTAKGDNRSALGLAGIAIKSGARSTLATFWKVDAEKTSSLIDSFYQEYVDAATRTPKQSKAKALQAAQLKLKQNIDNPSIWASYVLVGNWL